MDRQRFEDIVNAPDRPLVSAKGDALIRKLKKARTEGAIAALTEARKQYFNTPSEAMEYLDAKLTELRKQ